MGKAKLFPNPEYTSKQPRDGIVPRVPCARIFLGPSSKSEEDCRADQRDPEAISHGGRFQRV